MRARLAWRMVAWFSLATFVVGLGYAWSVHRRQVYLKALEHEVRGWGGQVNRWTKATPAWDPVRRVVGREFVDSIVGFDGYHVEGPMNREVEPDHLAQLLEFRPIRSFDSMNAKNIDDGWIGGIHDPTAVRSLDLRGTNISDRSIPKFLEMDELHTLVVEYTKVSDEAVERLIQLPRLRHLAFGGPNIRAVRLLELWTSDEQDRREDRADRATRLRGRLAIDPKLGTPSMLEVMGYQPATSRGFRGGTAKLSEESRGIYSFNFKLAPLSPGRTDVRIVVHTETAGRKLALTCRLPLTVLELLGPAEASDVSPSRPL